MGDFIELHWKMKDKRPQMTMVPVDKLDRFKEEIKKNPDVEWVKDEKEMEGIGPLIPVKEDGIDDDELERINSSDE